MLAEPALHVLEFELSLIGAESMLKPVSFATAVLSILAVTFTLFGAGFLRVRHMRGAV